FPGSAELAHNLYEAAMLIATYNVNGINGRLPGLLEWLEETAPDIVCLQELKAPDERFPEAAIRAAGYGAIWHGQKSWNGVAILARAAQPVEIRRGLPGEPDDTHSRYIAAAVDGMIVGCLYLPNAFARDAGLRIDHLLLSPPLAKRLIIAGVDREVRGREHPSDHAPAWIELAEASSASPGRGRRPKTESLR